VTLAPPSAEAMHSKSEKCGLCALVAADQKSTSTDGDFVVAYADDNSVVLLRTHLDGVLVAPRCHVTDVSTLAESSLPSFLAALRRTVEAVKGIVGGSGPVIEPCNEIPMTENHVCFRVASTSPNSLAPQNVSEVEVRADRFKRSLQNAIF
jgi:hypothetical protein